jgi:predicted RecB family nuclease
MVQKQPRLVDRAPGGRVPQALSRSGVSSACDLRSIGGKRYLGGSRRRVIALAVPAEPCFRAVQLLMFTLADGNLILAATDLTNHLACEHLTQQRLGVVRGERAKPRPAEDPHAELIRERGQRHEDEQLARLSQECGGHVDLSAATAPSSREELEATATATEVAMRRGVPLIYQAQFFDGRWQGRADFLRRIETPSNLGAHAYEVLDTKLSRQVKPTVVHQLSLYNRMLSEIQGLDLRYAHVVRGTGDTEIVDLSRYAALHRRVTRRLEAVVAAPTVATYPEPVAHCAICALVDECRQRLIADDHLSLVAGVRRDQRERLIEVGIATMTALATTEHVDPMPLSPERYDLLHHQADLQARSRGSGQPLHRHLEPKRACGYALLPEPSPGDVFFDLEGDPYVGDEGIEYLWGWWNAEAGYECAWAYDLDAEKAAFELFIDRVVELRAKHPGMHVFHYAPHELSKVRSLSVKYATREAEVDDLLRSEVLVDLHAVVRQGLQVGEDSYSLKKLERHHNFVRLETRVREGGGSIIAYETWLETTDDTLLEAIRAYNEEDCTSTLSLRDWLLNEMRPAAEAQFDVDFDDLREPEPEEEHGPPKWMPDVLALIDPLTAGLPAHGDEDDADQAERRLLSHLLLYHWREGKPTWWRYFDLREKPLDDLLDDRDAIAHLEPDLEQPPVPYKKSLDYSFTFPIQEFRLKPGAADDPTTDESYTVVAVEENRVVLRRGATRPAPTPVALVDATVIPVAVLREALMALAWSRLAGEDRFRAARALLRRDPPALASGALGEDVDSLVSATLGLDHSVLPVQGPPGTGKTFRGARMIVAALAAGRRVGITAPSHAAVHNLLAEVERCAYEQCRAFDGIYKGERYDSPHGLVEQCDENDAITDEHQLVAGTAWLFARDQHREGFDLVFIDEAGQFALADAAAVGLAAKNLVLLGDPQQLPQVTQSDHPGGSGSSVLEHILDGEQTIQPGRGVLLTETWRMHPDVCRFVSERSYDARLRSRDHCASRRITASNGAITGSGLRSIPVEHAGRSQASPEEAAAIAAACADLLADATVTDDEGTTRRLMEPDILVVAPYNLAVHCIQEHVPPGVRVGTVDRFQGQQAPVVFYAMTCSAAEDVPRGVDFLFDSHRFNVAISRAQCLAVLVHSPQLLDTDCNSLETMALVDDACRYLELAT